MAKKSKTPTKISELIPDDKNFNKGSEFGGSLISKSLQKFGAGRSILLDKNNRIIAGNKTVENAGAVGIENVQVVETDGKTIIAVKRTDIDLDTPEGRELALADNASAKANIVFDAELIEAEVGEVVAEEWGIEPVKKEVEEDGFDAEPPLNPITVLGDVYELNQHRFTCGSSTEADVVKKTMNGGKATIAFTSPPYNRGVMKDMGNHSDKLKGGLYKDEKMDSKTESEYISFLLQFTELSLQYSEFSFVNIAQLAGNKVAVLEYLHAMREKFVDRVVWAKSNGQPALAGCVMNSCFEDIFIFKNEKRPSRAINTRQFRGTVKNVYQSASQGGQNEFKEHHAATFPLAFAGHFIESFTPTGGSVLDCFLGSGTTLIAADQLNRACYGQEIDPAYCDIIVARFIKYKRSQSSGTETLTVKRNGKLLSEEELQKYLAQIEPKA